MSDTVIAIENLSKRYVIGHQSVDRERYKALRDLLARNARNLWRKTADMARGRAIVAGDETEEFWALRNVSFEVGRGEVIGIIGRNGAGKSTLLKILSRITEPTEGRVRIRGRVASLLEVGTGFHPELTGRENIYLNGAILGMTRAEIKRKFDEIVAFAEVEKFLDTPVKRYSSGMYVRLAFAVAAHLEQEILVVDEVLAVGDAEFQKKCLGKMNEVAGGGRTVLFVSHNMAAIEALCPRTLLLANGTLSSDARSTDVISVYLKQTLFPSGGSASQCRVVDEGLKIEALNVPQIKVHSGEPLNAEILFNASQSGQLRECALFLHSLTGARLGIVDLRYQRIIPLRYKPGRFKIEVTIASLPLVEGEISLGVYVVANFFSGNFFDLAKTTIFPSRSPLDIQSYPPSVQGYIIFDAEASVTALQDSRIAS